MESERFPVVLLDELLVNLHIFPKFLDFRLALYGVCPEVEACLWEADSIFVVFTFALVFASLASACRNIPPALLESFNAEQGCGACNPATVNMPVGLNSE